MSLTNFKNNNTLTNSLNFTISTRLLLVFLLAIGTLFSCGKEETIMSPFVGEWAGTFSGDDSGTLSTFVRNDGTLSMDVMLGGVRTNVIGRVTEAGKMIVGAAPNLDNPNDVFSVTGTLAGTSGSGEWESVEGGVKSEGSWKMEKE